MEDEVTTTEETATTENEDVTFETAFDQAIGGLTTEETTQTDPEPEQKVETEPDQKVETEPEQKVETRSAADSAEIEELRKSIEALKVEKAQEKERLASEEKPKVTEVEDKEWIEFEKDWPEVADVIKRERSKIDDRVKTLVAEALKPYAEQLGVVVKKTQDSELDQFVSAVKDKHPDALEELPKLMEWANSQPLHISVGINSVLENSNNPNEVIAVYDMYKEAKGLNKPKVVENDTSVDKTNILNKMEAVRSRRTSTVTALVDENDFDGAFNQAVTQIK